MEKAISLDKNNVEYLNELGSHKIRQEKVKEALKCYSKALRREKTNTTALLGQLKCQIFDEKYDEVEKQFELLPETVPAITTNPVQTFVFVHAYSSWGFESYLSFKKEFPYLKVVLDKKKNSDEMNEKLVDESITMHFKALKVFSKILIFSKFF